MAFGLSPKHVEELPLDNLSKEEFLVFSLEAAKELGWNIGYTNETGFVAYTKFSMSSWSEEIKVKIENGIASLKSQCSGNQMVDWGKNKKNIESLVVKINDLKKSFTAEELAKKYDELKPGLVSEDEDSLSQAPLTTKEKMTGVMAIFKPTEGYFVTPILIIINIVIFILMVISGANAFLPDNESLIKWGANFRPVTLDGEWWRLIASCFLHIGVLHLVMNMYALLYIGLLLEPHLGKTRFISAYLLTGVTASMTSLWWHDLTISAGASGAIFGMYGVFLAMLTTNLIEKAARQTLLTSIAIFVGYNLLNGMKGGVDNAAHIGGLISGLVIGYAYYPGLKKPDATTLKFQTIGALTILVPSTSFIVFKKIPNDIGNYDKKIQEFVSMEEKALEFYNMPEGTSKEKLLSEIKDTGIYYWKENIKLLSDLEKTNLPEAIHDRNKMLLTYCDLRIKSYNFVYQAIEQETDKYKDSIEFYNKQIESIIAGLQTTPQEQ